MNAHNQIHNAPCAPQVCATLYFGMAISHTNGDVGFVSSAQFDCFLVDHVTPIFPGFTLAQNTGYWKGSPERVMVLTLLSEDSDAFRATVRQIAEQYKTRFRQEAVAYSFTTAQFTLNCWPFGPVSAYHRDGKGY